MFFILYLATIFCTAGSGYNGDNTYTQTNISKKLRLEKPDTVNHQDEETVTAPIQENLDRDRKHKLKRGNPYKRQQRMQRQNATNIDSLGNHGENHIAPRPKLKKQDHIDYSNYDPGKDQPSPRPPSVQRQNAIDENA